MFRPATAGRIIADAPRSAFVVNLCVSLALIAAVSLTLMLWAVTVIPRPTGTRNVQGRVVVRMKVVERSMREAWADRVATGRRRSRLVLSVTAAMVGTLLCAALTAFLMLPSVYTGGRLTRCFGRSFRSTTAGSGLFILFVAALGVGWVKATHRTLLPPKSFDWLPGMLLATLASLCFLLGWLKRAALATVEVFGESDSPPRCEGCGYDLTHLPADGGCPECGRSVCESLTPDHRPGCAWESTTTRRCKAGWEVPTLPRRRADSLLWWQTTHTVIFARDSFYRTLKARSSTDRPRRFAAWQYVSTALASAVWFGVALIGMTGSAPGDRPEGVAVMLLTFVLVAWASGWTLHHGVGAMVSVWWFLRRMLPDPRVARKVFAYEAAFLWAFCAFNVVLLSTYMIFGNWLSRLLVSGMVYGAPCEAWAVLGGNLVLGLVWLARFHRSLAAVRWASF